jgi:hypothetical protein
MRALSVVTHDEEFAMSRPFFAVRNQLTTKRLNLVVTGVHM